MAGHQDSTGAEGTKPGVMRRLLAPVVQLREGEATTAVLLFAYSFLAMTGYNIVKPITRSKFISDLGADNLPWVQLVAGILIGGGGTVLATEGKDVDLPTGTVLRVRLDSAVTVR